MKHIKPGTRAAAASVWTGEPTRVYLEHRDGVWGLFFTQSWGGPIFLSFRQIIAGLKGTL